MAYRSIGFARQMREVAVVLDTTLVFETNGSAYVFLVTYQRYQSLQLINDEIFVVVVELPYMVMKIEPPYGPQDYSGIGHMLVREQCAKLLLFCYTSPPYESNISMFSSVLDKRFKKTWIDRNELRELTEKCVLSLGYPNIESFTPVLTPAVQASFAAKGRKLLDGHYYAPKCCKRTKRESTISLSFNPIHC